MGNTKHIEPLDWLRGLMALSIMLYHYWGWILFSLDSSTPLGKLGIYGVSIFFILSGLSMAVAYGGYIVSVKAALCFFIRRIFRILPLFWIAVFSMLILPILFHTATRYSMEKIILNLTTLFGFIKPGDYIPTGAWSIGNEMVYYALTPIILVFYDRSKAFGNIILLLIVLLGISYSQFILLPTDSLGNQWQVYINPINNLFLYVAGIGIFYNLKNVKINQSINLVILVVAWLLFMKIPCEVDQITLVTGIRRIIFSVLSIVIVVGFYKINIKLPGFLRRALNKLGAATYSIYLLHPIVYLLMVMAFPGIFNLINRGIIVAFLMVITLFLSSITYRYCEVPFINLGKKVTANGARK